MNDFGKRVKYSLIEKGKTQKWLVEEVRKKTGLYFDQSYLCKILLGQNNNKKMITAIADILNIEDVKRGGKDE